MIEPKEIYRRLREGERQSLAAVPRTHGIYALFDHDGEMRYVGITPGDSKGFYGRIMQRHVTGSEERSHKFSHAYNTGRMWRRKDDKGPDAKAAKALRTEFARRHGRAVTIVVEPDQSPFLAAIEGAVIRLAPSGQLLWNDKRGFDPYPEPTDLVDRLIEDLRCSPSQRAAFDRQLQRSRPAP